MIKSTKRLGFCLLVLVFLVSSVFIPISIMGEEDASGQTEQTVTVNDKTTEVTNDTDGSDVSTEPGATLGNSENNDGTESSDTLENGNTKPDTTLNSSGDNEGTQGYDALDDKNTEPDTTLDTSKNDDETTNPDNSKIKADEENKDNDEVETPLENTSITRTDIAKLNLSETKKSYNLNEEITGQVIVTGITDNDETADLTGDAALEYTLLQDGAAFSVTQSGEITALEEGTAVLVVTYGETEEHLVEGHLYLNAYFPEDESIRAARESSMLASMRGSAQSLMGESTKSSTGESTQSSTKESTESTPRSGSAAMIERQAVAGSGFSAVLDENGTVWTWGKNDCGQLGNGTAVNNPTPAPVQFFVNNNIIITQIAAGSAHMLALDTNGNVWAWGQGGLLGIGNSANQETPILIEKMFAVYYYPMPKIKKISTTCTHSFALGENGALLGWGSNTYKELGIDTGGGTCLEPVGIMSGISDISAGAYYSVAAKTDGSAWWWGRIDTYYNPSGAIPTQIPGTGNVEKVSAGLDYYSQNAFAMLLDEHGVYIATARFWNMNFDYLYVPGLSGATDLGIGGPYVIGASGGLWRVSYWREFNGTTIINTGAEATPVDGYPPLKSISISDHTLAVAANGDIYGMGDNSYGQVQDGLSNPVSLPIDINIFSNETWVWVDSTDTSGAIIYTHANDGVNDIGFWAPDIWGNPDTNGGIVSHCNYYTTWGYDFDTVLCKYTFAGTGVRWYSRRSPGTGNVQVYIDGVYKETVDLYKTWPPEDDYLAYELTDIPYGTHTLELKGASSPMDPINQYTTLPVVGFEYSIPNPPPNWTWVNSTDTSGVITYTHANDGINDIGFWTTAVWGNPDTNGGIVSHCNYYTTWGYDFNTILCKYTFSGSGVRWYSRRSLGAGNIKVYVDGAYKETVDLYKAWPPEDDYLAYELTNIPDGPHTLELKGASHPMDPINQYTLLPVVGFEYLTAENIPDFKVTKITASSGRNRIRVMFNNTLDPTYIITNAIIRDQSGTVIASSSPGYGVDPATTFSRGLNYIDFYPEPSIIPGQTYKFEVGSIKDINGDTLTINQTNAMTVTADNTLVDGANIKIRPVDANGNDVDTSALSVGDTFIADIELENITFRNFYMAQVAVYYDPTILQLVDSSGNPVISASGADATIKNDALVGSNGRFGTISPSSDIVKGVLDYTVAIKTEEVENGGYPTPDGKLFLYGLRFKILNAGNTQLQFAIEGKSPEYISGNPKGMIAFLGSIKDNEQAYLTPVIPEIYTAGYTGDGSKSLQSQQSQQTQIKKPLDLIPSRGSSVIGQEKISVALKYGDSDYYEGQLIDTNPQIEITNNSNTSETLTPRLVKYTSGINKKFIGFVELGTGYDSITIEAGETVIYTLPQEPAPLLDMSVDETGNRKFDYKILFWSESLVDLQPQARAVPLCNIQTDLKGNEIFDTRPDFYGNDIGQAILIHDVLNADIHGRIDNVDDVDFIKFTVPFNGAYVFTTTGDTFMEGKLFDSNGDPVTVAYDPREYNSNGLPKDNNIRIVYNLEKYNTEGNENIYYFAVNGFGGNRKGEYGLHVNEFNLSDLTVDQGTLSPAFDPGITNYTVTTPNTSINITATAFNANAKVSCGNMSFTGSGTFNKSLIIGTNKCVIRITSGDNWKEYTVNVIRLSNNAYLSSLAVGNSWMSPGFTYNTFDYSVSINYNVSSVTITAKTYDVNAKVTGTGTKSLNYGPNVFQITVTAEDKTTTKVYTVIVHRGYIATINNYYDQGYSSYFGSTAASKIAGCQATANQKFFDLCGLKITSNSPTLYYSPPDLCSQAGINSLCTIHIPPCSDLDTLISDAANNLPGSDIITSVIWSGNRIRCDYGTGYIDYNRSCSSEAYIFMLERDSDNNIATGVLIHEMSHQYSAKDHYHEILADGTCRGGLYCSNPACNPYAPGRNPRPAWCIMNDSRPANVAGLSANSIFCPGCQSDIENHLKLHH